MRRIAVVGANGFLGRSVVALCNQVGFEVFSVNRDSSRNFLEGRHKFDAIINVAAHIPHKNMSVFSSDLLESNVCLVRRIIQKYPGTKLIYSSSVSVYGALNEVITESSPFNQPNAYGLSKLAGEFIARCASNYSIVRFPSLYGPSMRSNTYVPRVISQAKNNGIIEVWGDGSRKQNYLHVDDAAAALIAAINCEEGGPFLAVDSVEYTNRQVAEAVAQNLPAIEVKYINMDSSPSFQFDASWTYKTLGWKPTRNLIEILPELISVF